MTLVDRLAAEYNRLVDIGASRDEAARQVDVIMELELEERRKKRRHATTGLDQRQRADTQVRPYQSEAEQTAQHQI